MSGSFSYESRKPWVMQDGRTPSIEELKLGCLQRIAEAQELIAKDHLTLINRERWAQERAERLQKDCDHLVRANAALRGHMKRMKRERA